MDTQPQQIPRRRTRKKRSTCTAMLLWMATIVAMVHVVSPWSALLRVSAQLPAQSLRYSYVLHAPTADGALSLYDNTASGGAAFSPATAALLWRGSVSVSAAGHAALQPVPVTSGATAVLPARWSWPGAAADFSELPASQQAVRDGRAMGIDGNGSDPRTADRLRRVAVTPPLWLLQRIASSPRASFLSSEWSCEDGTAAPAFTFADRNLTCWAAGVPRAVSPRMLRFRTSITLATAVARNIYPLTLTAAMTSLVPPAPGSEDDSMRAQTLLMLLHGAMTQRDAVRSVAYVARKNLARRDSARVAVGFLWAFAALVLLCMCILCAAFQSWLYPLFPQPYALFAWLAILAGISVGISVGTGVTGFILLLLIYGAYAAVVGVTYYCYRMGSRETPPTESEQKALLNKQNKKMTAHPNSSKGSESGGVAIAPAPGAGAAAAAGGGLSSIAPSPRSLLVRSRHNQDPNASATPPPPESTAATAASLSGESVSGGGLAGEVSPGQVELGRMDAAGSHGGSAHDDGHSDPSNALPAYTRLPQQLGFVQRRTLGFAAMFALLFLVACVALFGLWIVGRYRVLSSQDSAVLPRQLAAVEHIPQTIAKSVEAIYAFDGLANRLKLDSMFFHVSTEWCGPHYSAYLSDDQRYEAVQKDFVERYAIDMSVFDPSSYANYTSVNAFFTRSIRPEYRPLPLATEAGAVTSPVDARVTAWSNNPFGVRFWIKGRAFTMSEFLTPRGGAASFDGGSLLLLRLAPQDYHNFHAILNCTLRDAFVVEGGWHSINADGMTSKSYAIYNQRTVMLFDSDALGRFAVVALGALCVGSVSLVPPPGAPPGSSPLGATYARGDKLGYFEFGGSTIALVFRPGTVRVDDALVWASQSRVETLVNVNSRIGLAINANENAGLAPT